MRVSPLSDECLKHVPYSTLCKYITIFDHAHKAWISKQKEDRKLINDEFLSSKVQEKWFIDISLSRMPTLRRENMTCTKFIRGPHLSLLFKSIMNDDKTMQGIYKYTKMHHLENARHMTTILYPLFRHYGIDIREYNVENPEFMMNVIVFRILGNNRYMT
uniref:Uncharacterized protein n=1 Tax=Pithovirus LCPAC101 TaxID=2506586 RepID=A0A481Z5D7_9VIRU|nr:MAG: hypothetical protein LCPAC101_01530 [Pithovirus LCPAC101]